MQGSSFCFSCAKHTVILSLEVIAIIQKNQNQVAEEIDSLENFR